MLSPKSIILVSCVALSAAAAAAAVPPPNYVDLCYADITNLDADVKSLTAKVDSFNGDLVSVLPQLPLALQAVVATAAAGLHSSLLPQPLPAADLLRLAGRVNTTIAADIPAAVNAFVAKESAYEKAGLKTPVLLGLRLFLPLYERLANNILDRVPADAPKDRVDVLKSDVQGIIDSLLKGIRAYE
ncbi:Cell wall galactomannoprotein [Metarhizium album ARSEF 1941]|uniref:Cell wall galactomannoprotein n=1 Tax=Metarhizium album (strain ARSEF 1941) TaxID=1081103 RepID=A0A0B2X526_METAS|nr:Cell wall galactomannoprotein [Metarhizium album ARSEF 1941]KHO00401.1 Cell wall galactomannoprotein [Metarhizium album ARSEF 1941]